MALDRSLFYKLSSWKDVNFSDDTTQPVQLPNGSINFSNFFRFIRLIDLASGRLICLTRVKPALLAIPSGSR